MRRRHQLTSLATLRDATIAWPNQVQPALSHIDFELLNAASGGHALIGRNGCGKTLLASAIVNNSSNANKWLRGGTLERNNGWSRGYAQQVSFESHEELLDDGGTVYRVLGVSPGAMPSQTCQFLILRFGLYPLLYRSVTTLSTGEIRKVLLARALSTCPSLLVLDNAFDGLDDPSRTALKDLLSMTLKGFSQLLVQGIDARSTARTQVLLITHREEDMVDEITTISSLLPSGEGLLTEPRDRNRQKSTFADSSLLSVAMKDKSSGGDGRDKYESAYGQGSSSAMEEVLALCGRQTREPISTTAPLIKAHGLRVCRENATILLHDLNWCVRPGEHWLLAGGNGAGKSTLSKLLAQPDSQAQGASGNLHILGKSSLPCGNNGAVAFPNQMQQRDGVGWVSTELHLSIARSPAIAWDVLLSHHDNHGRRPDQKTAEALSMFFGLDSRSLGRSFCHLSQGEQKLVLIAAAILKRPALLILDEPCQALDLINRNRVLSLVNALCCTKLKYHNDLNKMTLVYITHHYDEVLPCVTHVMHLQAGVAHFCGERTAYEASDFHLLKRT